MASPTRGSEPDIALAYLFHQFLWDAKIVPLEEQACASYARRSRIGFEYLVVRDALDLPKARAILESEHRLRSEWVKSLCERAEASLPAAIWTELSGSAFQPKFRVSPLAAMPSEAVAARRYLGAYGHNHWFDSLHQAGAHILERPLRNRFIRHRAVASLMELHEQLARKRGIRTCLEALIAQHRSLVRLVERNGKRYPQLIGAAQLATLMRRHLVLREPAGSVVEINAMRPADAPNVAGIHGEVQIWLKSTFATSAKERESICFYLPESLEQPVVEPVHRAANPPPALATGTTGVVVPFRRR